MEENNVVYEQPIPEGPQQSFDPSGLNPWQRIQRFCSDGKFLAVCVLYSVSVACSIFGWLSFSLPVIEILFTIFLWMAYAAAKNNKILGKDVKKLSGTVFALEIVRIVDAVVMVGVGFLFNLLFGFFGSENFARMILKSPAEIKRYVQITQPLMELMSLIMMIVVGVCAIIIILMAVLGIGAIHKFVKTAYKSADTGVLEIKSRKTASGWLIAFAIIYGLSALSILFYITGAVQYGSLCAAFILLSQLIKKYYGDC